MTLGSFLIVGKFENDRVVLFDEPVVAMRGNIENGDIARLENDTVEYVRFYEDGRNMRSWYITDQVLAAYDAGKIDVDQLIDESPGLQEIADSYEEAWY